MATDDATVAAVFRAVLALGIATPADLVPWADGQVMARDRPAEWVIDLSLSAAKPVDAVDALLRPPSVGADPAIVFRLMVGLVDGSPRWTYEQGRRADEWLWAAALQWGEMSVLNEITAIDDGFYLMQDEQRGDPAALVANVVAFVAKHADPAARAWLPGVRVTFADDAASRPDRV